MGAPDSARASPAKNRIRDYLRDYKTPNEKHKNYPWFLANNLTTIFELPNNSYPTAKFRVLEFRILSWRT